MKHKTVHKKLLQYIDGDLPENEMDVIKTHLEKCEYCSQNFELLSDIWKSKKDFERKKPSPFLWSKIKEQIKSTHYSQVFWKRPLEIFPSMVRAAMVPLAMALALFAGVQIGSIMVTQSHKDIPAPVTHLEIKHEFGLDYFNIHLPGSLSSKMYSYNSELK